MGLLYWVGGMFRPKPVRTVPKKLRFIERIEKGGGDETADFEETREIANTRLVVNYRG